MSEQTVITQTQKLNIKNSSKQQEEIQELLISGGAGAMPFMAGFIHGLIQIIGKEKLKKFKIGGVSSGAIAAGYLYFCINQDKYDMKYMYEEQLRRPYQEDNKKYYGLFTNGQIFREAAVHYLKLCKETNVPKLDDNLHFQTTVIGKYYIPEKKIISDFKDENDLGDALESTCNIPFLIKKSFFTSYRGQKTLDGGIMGPVPYKYENSQKVFINFLPKFMSYHLFKQPKNTKYVHVTENTDIKFPLDYWLWDTEWADEMFLKGILEANNQAKQLMATFGIN